MMTDPAANQDFATIRRYFIGGSDARIIMGDDETALVRLWREKRGEAEPEDLSGNLIVQLGVVTEDLNRRWYEANTGQVITDIQRRVLSSGAALDGGYTGWPGRGQRRGVRSQVHAAVVILGGGSSHQVHAAAAAQYVGRGGQDRGALGDHGRRQVGRDSRPCRSALSAPHCHRREEVLALCRERRGTKAVWRRAAKAPDRGGAHCRHEHLQCLGGIRRHLCRDPLGPSRA